MDLTEIKTMTKTKEEILDMIYEESFTEWFLTTQSQIEFQRNKFLHLKIQITSTTSTLEVHRQFTVLGRLS